MRTTLTFVLRLLVDPAEPNQLRGTLYSVADNADYPFTETQMLLELLQQLSGRATPPAQTDQSSEEEDE